MLPHLWTSLALLVASAAALPIQPRATPPSSYMVRRRKTHHGCSSPDTTPTPNPIPDLILPETNDLHAGHGGRPGHAGNAGNSTTLGNSTTVPDGVGNSTTVPDAVGNSTAVPDTVGNNTDTVGNSTTLPDGGTNYPRALFDFGGQTKMRGVNLGGWLVLEGWMTPSLYAGGNEDVQHEGQLGYDRKAQYNPDMIRKLKNHWRTFITEDDIQQIANAGLNTVRIPVGYWSLLDGGVPGEPYIPGALEYLDPVIEKCAQLGVTVFIVLHGLPGSQNGQDNSGQAMGDAYQWFHNEEYKGKSIDAVNKAVDRYGNGKFGGIVKSIELVNEPKPRWDTDDDLDFQKGYFMDSYASVRARDANMNVMYSDGWRAPTLDSTWGGFGNGQTNISMDTHIYTLWGETSDYGYTRRLQSLCSNKDSLISQNTNMPTIVGEWTTAVGMGCADGDCETEVNDAYRDYLAKSFEWQTWVFEHATGWVYWNWKLDRDDAWSFQTGIKEGWIPKDLSSKARGGTPCQFW